MGTIIKSVAIAKPIFQKGILAINARAAKRCLKSTKTCIQNVGMLISAGVYNENHLKEPALAALIHKRLFNRFCIKKLFGKDKKNTFSFDLHKGGGGAHTAIEVIDGFIQSGEIDHGLVVAGDTKPITGSSENYNYSSGAGAILLSKGNENKGFIKFSTETFPEFISDLESSTNWDTGSFRFFVNQKNDYLKNCVECAVKSIQLFFENENLNWNEVDLVITSQSPKGFVKKLQHELGLKNKLIQINGNGEIYSAGIIYSLNKAFHNQKFKKAKNILFLTVGAGITTSLSLYKN